MTFYRKKEQQFQALKFQISHKVNNFKLWSSKYLTKLKSWVSNEIILTALNNILVYLNTFHYRDLFLVSEIGRNSQELLTFKLFNQASCTWDSFLKKKIPNFVFEKTSPLVKKFGFLKCTSKIGSLAQTKFSEHMTNYCSYRLKKKRKFWRKEKKTWKEELIITMKLWWIGIIVAR